MPTTIVNPQIRSEPLIGAGFAVQIGSEIKGWFTECSSLTIEREVKSHPEGGVNHYVHQLPGRLKRASIRLKHGLAGNELWEWFQKGAHDGQVERRNVSIIVYDASLTEVNRWNLTDVYPSKWQASGLNSSNNEIVVETLEFSYFGGETDSGGQVQRALDGAQPGETAAAPAQSIDQAALAERVYRLLKQEIRLERQRLGQR
ncbi:MAG: phage tail protein [Anaerolineae bacterium]|nr:phage tail protein [Anaerolineae bacterium]